MMKNLMHFRMAKRFVWTTASLVVLLFPLLPAKALAPGQSVKLVPHRAVYDMALDTARSGAGVVGIIGRMVFEFTGSPCEGYMLNMRFVTRVTDRQGSATITDLRSSSWEQADGKKFRFNSSQYLNQKLSEVTSGDASRNAKSSNIEVRLKKPSPTELQLPSKVLFPTQHSIRLLKAAHKGENILQADIYDGSEKGAKIYSTTAIIGKSFPEGSNKEFDQVKNSDKLDDLISWPVSISYYEDDKEGEGLPSYQLAFRLFSNGVSRKLLIDYGDFSIKGSLSSIEFYKSPACK